MRFLIAGILIAAACDLLRSPEALAASQDRPPVHHELDVSIDPGQGTIAVTDRLSIPDTKGSDDNGPWDFLLHRDLDPRIVSGPGSLERIGARGHLELFRLRPNGSATTTLAYGGRIQHRLEDIREDMGRSRQNTRGIISTEGVFLNGYSGWYPLDPDRLLGFDLEVELPAGWLAVSQGAGPEISRSDDRVRVRWRETQPQDEVFLIAAGFERYTRSTPTAEAQVYLRRPDPELAATYLSATGRYLDLYSRLVGPYPYAKFALVENFWETGLGMPSFTLLGPRVIRLPFIVHTSFPHEILHNWWGNGVYVDYDAGNWSEGLTAYLADHLLAEQRGAGADYRRDTLRSYADYVRATEDFPLRAFKSRHGSASQAVGYGKGLMMLHMLRRELGDRTFVAGLRRFYSQRLFRTSGFDDLRRAMEQESGRDLAEFFRQWTQRTGAPILALDAVRVEPAEGDYLLRGRLAQTQDAPPFPLRVPILVHLDDGAVIEHAVPLGTRRADFELRLPAAPIRVDLDPRFDLFRALAPGESPATFSDLFGADSGIIVLPADAPPDRMPGYRKLAAAWRDGAPGWKVLEDKELKVLPKDRPVWLLGRANRFLADLSAARPPAADIDAEKGAVRLPEGAYAAADFSLALVFDDGDRTLGWIASPRADAIPGLARKLPHYGKYSYLAFQGAAPSIAVKGQWPAQDSALRIWLTEQRPRLTTPERKPLTAALE